MLDAWQKPKKLFSTILILVLIVHVCLLVIKFYDPSFSRELKLSDSAAGPTTKPMKITLLKNNKRVFEKKRQIVQSEGGKNVMPPEEAYLGEKNRTFDRQTVAKKVDLFNKAGKGSSEKADSKFQESKVAEDSGRFKSLSLSELGSAAGTSNPYAVAAKQYSKSRDKQGVEDGDENSKGVSSTNDYIADVPLGDFTHLNTVEFKYYGFYHRIRQKLEQFWGRSIQEKAQALSQNGRRIASEELVTALVITLDEMGEIIAIKVRGSSGVKELDDAAIESFNEAGPFPNPPKDLVTDGKVTIEWGFVISST